MRLIKIVEGMEKFLLRGFLSRNELDVVDEKNVGLAVFFAEFDRSLIGNGCDELICKLFALHVYDVCAGVVQAYFVGYGVEKMCFSESGLTVDEKRIVGCSRIVGYRNAGGMGKFIGISYNKAVKGIFTACRRGDCVRKGV